MIYHIAHKKDWEASQNSGSYKTNTFQNEGFIHCSPIEKVIDVANNFFKGKDDLVLLCIDETLVKSKIVWEDLYDHGFKFPHIYGEVNKESVVNVNYLKWNEDGFFDFPDL